MANNNQTEIVKDLLNRKITITRKFEAPLEDVWRAWTESDLLDQWWMPKPWVAKTKSFSFEVGGNWLFSTKGPDGPITWVIVEFISINRNRNFNSISSFCDENGNKNLAFPTTNWKNEFTATSTGTKVEVEISCTKEGDIEKLIEMGFEAGFTMALGNLEELLGIKI